jgi:shikimate kinase
MKKVILVGYMGSGKSSVGALLASKLGISYYDLDAIIEQIEQLSVSELFTKKGEIYFRKIEHTALQKTVEINEPFVLSLGGGTPCYFNNHELILQDNIVSFYLKGTAATLSNRLLSEKEKRPLLSSLNAEELPDFINKHLFDRSYYYHQVSHVITIESKSVEALATEIYHYLR